MNCRSLLVLGGARSGKSAYALKMAEASAASRIFLATAEPFDDEMRARIEAHRRERGDRWTTREAPIALVAAIDEAAGPQRIVLVDCLTLWLNNLIYRQIDPSAAIDDLCSAIARLTGPVILVSNELGLGLVPETPVGRSFRDWQGRLNSAVARACDSVVLIVAGLPLPLKPAPEPDFRLG